MQSFKQKTPNKTVNRQTKHDNFQVVVFCLGFSSCHVRPMLGRERVL